MGKLHASKVDNNSPSALNLVSTLSHDLNRNDGTSWPFPLKLRCFGASVLSWRRPLSVNSLLSGNGNGERGIKGRGLLGDYRSMSFTAGFRLFLTTTSSSIWIGEGPPAIEGRERGAAKS